MYPFRLRDDVLTRLDAWADAAGKVGALYSTQLRPQFAFLFSPLLYKEAIAQALLIAAVGAYLLAKVLESRARRRTRFAPMQLLRQPGPWIIILLAYVALSAFYLSPTLNYSMRTCLTFAAGALALLAALDTAASPNALRKLMATICMAGGIIASVSLLQQLGMANWFLPQWDDPRNRLGSFIGHNTGLSSWLLFPFSFGLYYLIAPGRLPRRVLGGALAVLILFVIIAAQSRAVWLVVFLLLPPYLFLQLKKQGMRFTTRRILMGVLIVLLLIASQTVAPEKNPLARHMVPLGERLKQHVLNPDQLLRETRLRILVASLPLIAEKPLFGHGFGSFQYVYPPAQGRYFRENPDTWLGTTIKRTDLAHNDYLQWLVECGIVGFVLLCIPVFLLLKRVYLGYRGATPYLQTRLLALLFPMAGVSLQAFVDFPFHIMPIALVFGFSFVLCSTQARLRENVYDHDSEEQPFELPPAQTGRRLRPQAVTALVAVTLFMLTSPLMFVFILRHYASDIYATEGSGWQRTAALIPEAQRRNQYHIFSRAKESFRKALHINPFNGEAYEGIVFAGLNLAALDFKYLRDAERAGNKENAEAWKQTMRRNLEFAMNQAQNQHKQGELEYHFSLYQFGEIYNLLSRLHPEIPNYRQSAEKAYQMALDMNTADTYSLLKLIEMIERAPQPDRKAADAVKRRIFEVDPDFGHRRMIQPIVDLGVQGEFGPAYLKLNRLAEIIPNEWRLKAARAELLLRESTWPPLHLDGVTTSVAKEQWLQQRLRASAEALNAIPQEQQQQDAVLFLRMFHSATSRDYQRALEIADLLSQKLVKHHELQVFRHRLAKKLNQERPIWDYQNDIEYWHAAHRFHLFYLHEQYRGAVQLARYSDHLILQVAEGLRTAAFLRAIGDTALLKQVIAHLRQHYPYHGPVRKLEAEVQAVR